MRDLNNSFAFLNDLSRLTIHPAKLGESVMSVVLSRQQVMQLKVLKPGLVSTRERKPIARITNDDDTGHIMSL